MRSESGRGLNMPKVIWQLVMELQAQRRSACCLALFFLHCSLLLWMELPVEFFLENSRSLPSFVAARGLPCGFHIFVSWAQKVDRVRSSKNSSISESALWNTIEKTRKQMTYGIIGKWCQRLSQVFVKQMWQWSYSGLWSIFNLYFWSPFLLWYSFTFPQYALFN